MTICKTCYHFSARKFGTGVDTNTEFDRRVVEDLSNVVFLLFQVRPTIPLTLLESQRWIVWRTVDNAQESPWAICSFFNPRALSNNTVAQSLVRCGTQFAIAEFFEGLLFLCCEPDSQPTSHTLIHHDSTLLFTYFHIVASIDAHLLIGLQRWF